MKENFSDLLESNKSSVRASKKSEEKFRMVFDNANDAIFIHTFNGRMLEVNQTACERLGYSKEELLKLSPMEIDTPEYFALYNERVVELQEKGTFVIETAHVCKDGTVIPIELSTKIILHEGLPAILSIARDITKRKSAKQKMNYSEEKYRFITENINDLIVILNEDYEYEYINEPVHKKLMGYSKEDLIGKSALIFIHPDDLNDSIKNLKRGFSVGEGIGVVRIKKKNGDYKWLEVKGRTFKNIDNEKKGLIISRDVSERKRTEQKLKESEEKYRDLFENAPYSIILSSPDGNMLEANETTVKIFGFGKDEIIGNNFLNLGIYTPRQVRKFVKRFLAMKKGEKVPSIELQVKKKDGNLIWITYKSSLIKVDNQLLIETIIQDITDRKLIEQQLRKSEEEYRLITENANDLIALLNQKLRYIYINEAVHERFLGYSKRDLIGKNLGLFIHPDDIKYVFNVIRENWKKGEVTANLRFKKSDGTYIWLEVRGVISKSAKGELLGVTISRDITERREYEKKLKESEEKYQMAFNRATFYKDLFAHDINNILQIINSSSELIIRYRENIEKSRDVKSLAEGIRAQVIRGSKLISNVHALSEIEEKNTPLRKVKVIEVLNESINFIKNYYLEKEIKIQIDFKNSPIFILANFFLKEVFDNILLNAIKHNKKSIVEILIRGTKEKRKNKNFFKIEFLDNGIGIPKDKKKIIFKKQFKPYQRLKGMGLGLSLVKEIMRKYNAKIRVEDKVKGDYSKGSNFILLFQELL